MPALGYLELIGSTQGEITGGATREHREGQIEFLQFNHQVEMSKGKSYGLPLGIRTHKPLNMMKLIDEASPKMMQMLCTEERITSAIFSWYNTDDKGEQELFYSIKIENAFVSKIDTHMPELLDENWDKHKMMETVSFIYERISWSWGVDGTIEFEDEWA